MVSKILTFAAALTIASFVATAQETKKNPVEPFNPEFNEARDENGKIQRHSYITNPWYDNWTFGIAGGIQTTISKEIAPKCISPAISVYAIKWFTPVIAARFAYTGFNGKDQFKDGYVYDWPSIGSHSLWPTYDKTSNVLSYNRHQFRFDLMWNIINTFWGYQYNRFWTVSPYISGGYQRMVPAKYAFGSELHDNEIFGSVGFYNAFRVSDHFNITLDLRSNFYSARYYIKDGGVVANPVVELGVSYTIHKWYWNRVKPIEKARDAARADANANAAKADAALQDAQRLQKDLDAANAQIAQLKADAPKDGFVLVDEDELSKRVASSDMVVYYNINKSNILPTEQKHIDEYVTTTLARDPRHVFYLTGSADKGTGNEVINARLGHERAEGVKALIMKKYNVPEEQVIIKATVISDLHEDPSLDRCVLIESK